MNKDDIKNNLLKAGYEESNASVYASLLSTGLGKQLSCDAPTIEENIKSMIEREKNRNIPTFKFALREDLKDDKRFLPERAEPLSTGYDVRAAFLDKKPLIIKPFEYFKIPLGFKCFCPDQWYYQLHPRSSSFTKKYMHNLIGIIDESWEGDTLFAGQYIPDVNSNSTNLIIEYGEKIGQLVMTKRVDVEIIEISNKECNDLYSKRNAIRKSGGFGSTG